MKVTFNRLYFLKPDEGRALIMSAQNGRDDLMPIDETFETIIHPLFAMIFSFCDGREVNAIVNDVSALLHTKVDKVRKFIEQLTDNKSFIQIKHPVGLSTFPPYTLCSCDSSTVASPRFSWKQYTYSSVDLRQKRHYTPSSITLMVNNVCYTNCYYCYVDKRIKKHCSLSFNNIKRIITEARSLNVRSFDVIGGEFFLYDHWFELLEELYKNGFNPYISTKIPIDDSIISKLVSLKVPDIQISLDSLIDNHLKQSLSVGSFYIQAISNSIKKLSESGIKIYIHTVLSQKTETVDDLRSIYDLIKDLHNIAEWKIDKAGKSLYTKESYCNIEVHKNSYAKIYEYINKLKYSAKFPIRLPRPSVPTQLPMNNGDFFERGLCSGNYNSLFILPDGNVTMCEELYWNKKFLLGNVQENTLLEIWNSEKAHSLFYIPQEAFPDDSFCSKCPDFDKCRSVRQVCYKEIIKQYGSDKWYYPDVNCPKKYCKQCE